MEKEGKNAGEVIDDLNTHSGLLGMSEYSNDMRDIVAQCKEGNEKAILAKNKFIRRVVDYISQYYTLLEGCDVIAFTAGVGENNSYIRKEILDKLACLGVKYDPEQNNVCGEFVKLSTDDSKVLVYVIPTDEELMIARDTLSLIKNR
jgi:acetate kinase